MGRSISVKIGQTEFKSKKAAVDYFMDLREAMKESGPLKDGKMFDELHDLYLRYCEATDFALNGKVVQAFSVDYEPRKNGDTWAAYLCYWVHFSEKQKWTFSIDKAVTAVVKAGNIAEQQ